MVQTYLEQYNTIKEGTIWYSMTIQHVMVQYDFIVSLR